MGDRGIQCRTDEDGGMSFIHFVVVNFIGMPLRGHLLSIFEGLMGFGALQLYADGHEGWGLAAMAFVMLFSYTDGACGWSVRKELYHD
jgi:hypothetical protein